MRWREKVVCTDKVKKLQEGLNVSIILARLLSRLEFNNIEKFHDYLTPRLKNLQDPFQIKNIKAGVDRVLKALQDKEKILILGDYDVDGITSSVLLAHTLKRLGADPLPQHIVPKRSEEGYGLTRKVIDRALKGVTPDVFIAVDCGTNSYDSISYLRSLGIEVIIIDHHRSQQDIDHGDCVLINPHIFHNDDEPWLNLCSVGLVFKFIHGLVKKMRVNHHPIACQMDLRDCLDLVALGTVADLVPLIEENRILTKAGLKRLRETNRIGLQAILKTAGIDMHDEITSFDIAFKLGPRINASGRIDDASLPVKILLSEDKEWVQEHSQHLNTFNNRRQQIERSIFEEAIEQIEALPSHFPGYVLHASHWHTGVVGIVASRLVQKYNRPCLVLGSEGEMAKGSGRSINGVDLIKGLEGCLPALHRWGGHPMAIGVTLSLLHLEQFKVLFHKALENQVKDEPLEKTIEIDQWIDLSQITPALLDELDLLHPFGNKNPEPIFGIKGFILKDPPRIFGKERQHFSFELLTRTKGNLKGVSWRMAERLLPVEKPVDLACKINWNTWNGQKKPQINLIDWRLSESNLLVD